MYEPGTDGAPRSPSGFRFSLVDGLFILLMAATAWLTRDPLGEMVWLIPIVVGHFFLFCNLFRVRRRYELIWAALFLANTTAWLYLAARPATAWIGVLAVQTPLTVLLIGLEIRSPAYHGIFSRPRG